MFQKTRVPHIIKPHKGNRTPVNMLFFDTETVPDPTCKEAKVSRQILSFGYAYAFRLEDGRRTRESWCRFTDSESFFRFAESRLDRERPLYSFAHNLGFDLTITDFWHYCESPDFDVDYFVLDDPPSFIIGKHKGRKWNFIDTLNYWRQSLKSIARSVGLEKLEMPAGSKNKKLWDKYCKRDVEILAHAVCGLISYIKTNELGQFGLSAASISMSSYKHRFMKHEIFIHDNMRAIKLERDAYYGGLVNCFYLGKIKHQKTYKLDVNSMYPFVMLNQFPSKLLEYSDKPVSPWQVKPNKSEGLICECNIASHDDTYPMRFNSKLCYVKGTFTTCLCGPEYERAFFAGRIKQVTRFARYELSPLFREYINYFWQQRQLAKYMGDDCQQYFIKIFMNSLYGKFGQLGYGSAELQSSLLESFYLALGTVMPTVYHDKSSWPTNGLPQSYWKPLGLSRPLTIRQIGSKVTVKVPNGEHTESFPAIAAYVTSYARELLLGFIKTAGRMNTFYCDTDSLFVNQKGYENLVASGSVSQTELGKLKLEDVSNDCEFNGLKDYVFAGERKLKGIRATAKELGNNRWEQIQFEGVKKILKRGFAPFVDVRTIVKHLNRQYSKGHRTTNGWVTPFVLPDDLEAFARSEI